MQIVIDIDENVYTRLFDNGIDISTNDRDHIETCIRGGTILPKGHGRLIDADNIDYIELVDLIYKIRWTKDNEVDLWIDAPVVIEADKED